MSHPLQRLQSTKDSKLLLIPRILAGGVLLSFSLKHFQDLGHFRDILTATGLPFVGLTVIAASATEFLAGLILLSGFLSRIGGLLGVFTMAPAIYSTLILMRMTVEELPSGMGSVPFVPPLPLPVVVFAASLLVVIFGGGRLSVDWSKSSQA
jgi:uncharacterized membrane protein YphA (DoxX/SURF4 family)